MVTFDFTKTPVTKIVDAIIINSSKMGTSDIHFDPREDGIIVRTRIDGDLVDYTFIPKVYGRNLTTRLKLMAGMNITESRLPQDGAIKGKFGDKDLDMRVSCLPTNEGEKIVIRILDYSRSLSGIDQLGFNNENFIKLKNMIGVPNGIILVTGATGSGKSTTTYSILQVLNKERTNIITVEDPIEMNIEGMNQVQVNSEIGLDFATVLRSILRQDPNVILIGEIRDSETAKIAVRASITGHLVLSTIHTNNSLSTIERLLDMDVERYLLSTALTGIISQRLAKTLCPKCRIKRETTPYEKKVFKLALKKDVTEIHDANHKGCENCNKGYRGRIAIQEVLEIDDDIRNLLNSKDLDKEELKKLVYGSGNVITMLQDGLYKVLSGHTSFEEIYRIIEIDNDINDSCYSGNDLNMSKEKQIEIEQERTRELNELKRLEEVVASKATDKTQSIIDQKVKETSKPDTPTTSPNNENKDTTKPKIETPNKENSKITTQSASPVVNKEKVATPQNKVQLITPPAINKKEVTPPQIPDNKAIPTTTPSTSNGKVPTSHPKNQPLTPATSGLQSNNNVKKDTPLMPNNGPKDAPKPTPEKNATPPLVPKNLDVQKKTEPKKEVATPLTPPTIAPNVSNKSVILTSNPKAENKNPSLIPPQSNTNPVQTNKPLTPIQNNKPNQVAGNNNATIPNQTAKPNIMPSNNLTPPKATPQSATLTPQVVNAKPLTSNNALQQSPALTPLMPQTNNPK